MLPDSYRTRRGCPALRRRARTSECCPLLELRAHLRRTTLEERLGIPELELSRGVIDGVVGATAQQIIAYVNALAAFANLKAVQRKHAAIGGRVGIEMNPQCKDGRRTLRREIIARRAI